MSLVFRFPTNHPSSYNNRAPRGNDGFFQLEQMHWRETGVVSTYQQHVANPFSQQAKENYPQGTIKIASMLLGQYRPEEISIDVDSEKVILHGLHRLECEDGFEQSEFMRVFKIPQGVDPTTVTSHTIITQDGAILVIEGSKRKEKKANDGKFEAKLDCRGFRPEDIKIQLRGNELTVTRKHPSERHPSRGCSRRLLLPDDVDLKSVTSRLSKEGLLTIEASHCPRKTVDVTVETDEPDEEDNELTRAEAGENAN